MPFTTEQIYSMASRRLSEKRFGHSVRVAEIAKKIAGKTDIDPEKMYIAGLLHDIAKEIGNTEILKLCERTGRYIPTIEKEDAHSLHGLAGACIAYEEFDIRDEGMLMAIAFHSGRVAMRTEEKILFLADGIDNGYKYGIDPSAIWEQPDLDSALLMLCMNMLKFCVENKTRMNARMQDSFDFIMEHLKKHTTKAEEEKYRILRNNTDKIVDKATDIYLSHRINIHSVNNIRDAGNYRTVSGKMIKKLKIIRSGALSALTCEDAKKLKQMGVNCIIDLRTDEEVNAEPDINIEGFIFHRCPLSSAKMDGEGGRFHEYAAGSISDDEMAWYISQYMRYIDVDQKYRGIILGQKSILQLRKIFELLLDETVQGVLIHGSSGKDRTGIVIMLIQIVLGMNAEEVVNDYYASMLPYYMIAENTALLLEQNGYSSDLSEKVREMYGLDAHLVHNLNKWWKENSIGTVEAYISDTLLISGDIRQKLCDKYLDRAAVDEQPEELS